MKIPENKGKKRRSHFCAPRNVLNNDQITRYYEFLLYTQVGQSLSFD